MCVKLFLEQGYKKTTVAEIVQRAEVSNSSFQNIFRAKDGVLTELVRDDAGAVPPHPVRRARHVRRGDGLVKYFL